MSLAAFKVFSDFAQGTMTEILQQQVELFNNATKGGLVLVAARNAGDFSDKTNWAKLNGLVRRRNPYGSGTVTELDLSQLAETSVKVAAGTPPVRLDPGQFEWILKNPKEGGVVFGQQLAVDRMADMLDVAIAAFTAAHAALPSNYYNGKAGIASLDGQNLAAAKLGDAAGRLACWVSHSKPMFDLWGAAIANGAKLFTFGTINIASDPFGRPIVISDAPSLSNPTGIDDGDGSSADGDAGGVVAVPSFRMLGLVPGAVRIEDNGDYTENLQTMNGGENITRTIQAEWSYNVGLRGFAWDKSSGGHAPSTAALATATNWDKQATSFKDLGGVVYESK